MADRCVTARNVCLEAEQLVVQAADFKGVQRYLKGVRSLFDHFVRLSPGLHGTVRLAENADEPYSFLPLVVLQEPPAGERMRFLFNHTPSVGPRVYREDRQLLLFFSQGVDNVAEVFHRSITLLHDTIPLLAGCRGCPPVELATPVWMDGFHYLLEPFLTPPQKRVRTLAPMPPRRDAWGLRWAKASRKSMTRYRLLWERHAAEQYSGPRCFARCTVCDYSHEAHRMQGIHSWKPWEAMQKVMSYYGHASAGPSRLRFCDAEERTASGDCKLHIGIVKRSGRRKLANLEGLLASCQAWRPLEVACSTISFGNGLLSAAAELRRMDVLIAPHGADLINGLAMHAGASVLEVLPIFNRQACPCDVFLNVFGAERRVFGFRLDSRNPRFSVSNGRTMRLPGGSGKTIHMAGNFHSDLVPPWSALQRVLELITDRVRGDRSAYESLRANETTIAY